MKAILAFLVLGSALQLSGCASRNLATGAVEAPAAVNAADPSAAWTGDVASEMDGRARPLIGTRGMVVADDRIAAEWGAEVLRKGGNAVDAAVATGLAMAVTRPHFASLGGGGFMVYCPKPLDGKKVPCISLDYREQAPAAATRDMYLRDGKPRTDLSQDGALASGVPGVPAGLLTAHAKFGAMPLKALLKRPIELARQGYLFSGHTEAVAFDRWDAMNPEAKRIFGCTSTGAQKLAPCPVGTLIKQPDLARVLEEIGRKGPAGFYEGWVAKKIAEGLKAAGGIMTEADLKAYQPKWRNPVVGQFRGMEVVSMGPPSSGGAVMLQMLGFAERANAQSEFAEGFGSAKSVHAIAHGMTLAFSDRAKHFGDPDQVHVPLDVLLLPAYMDARWKTFDPKRANYRIEAGVIYPKGKNILLAPHEGMNTTHFSVIDREGNAVAITTTVNENFGSGFVPPGTGIVMNNEMDDFSVQPGVPNLFGLVGAEANAVGPGKRPLSSMSPTVVRDGQGNARLVVGAAGGPTITTSVYQTILNRYRFGMSLPDAVAAPRIHTQWRPMELRLERFGLHAETRDRLIGMDYAFKDSWIIGKVHALERFPNGRVWGVPDPRAEGAAVAE